MSVDIDQLLGKPTRFGAILIDPAWPQDNFVDKDVVPARGDQPYKTMSLADIAGLPLQELMAPDCAIFLWTLDNLPDAALHLAWAWGRPGKPLRIVRANQFIWHKTCLEDPTKTRYGMGRWARGGSESITLLVQGRPRVKKAAEQMIHEPRRQHSRKPDEIYTRIQNLVDGPYLEMFARQQWPGWHSWGNEIDKFIAQPRTVTEELVG